MKHILLAIAILCIENTVSAQISVTATAGTPGPTSYTTLKASFDAINLGTHQGVIVITVDANTTETASAVLNASGSGSASYTSINIYPTVTGLSVSGNLAAPLIDLNGADNVTIDGRVNATGSTIDLIINNTSTSAVAGTNTVRFINDACTNIVKYCTLKGSTTADGIINFSTTTGTTGNDGNTIDNNDITNSTDLNRPVYAILSSGTSAKENSSNTISNNNIYNFLSRVSASYCIIISQYSTAWTISGNSFYETASFVPGGAVGHNVIYINNSTGVDFTISNNYIGGSAASCGGTAWTKTNANNNTFTGIYLNVGTATASNVQGNTLKNFTYANSSSANWTGIQIAAGKVNIGTVTGNTIGAATGNSSILFTAGATGANFYGINTASTSTIDFRNNTIGAITVANSASLTTHFYGFNNTGAGTITIQSNTIGSTDAGTSNSINATSLSTGAYQVVYGIISNTGTLIISGNTISKLSNQATQTSSSVAGMYLSGGTNTISNNTIRDLISVAPNIGAANGASCIGIIIAAATTVQTITGNTIYNLSNTYASPAAVSIMGIFYTGSTVASTVNRNFIHSLSVDAANTTGNLYGIKINSGATTYSNNIITLGGNTSTTIYGIYETGLSSQNNSLYFNTVYIGGAPTAGAINSYALYSAVTTNTRDFRNNIFSNARSNNGATGKHYAAYFAYAAATSLTLNYNNYYAPGTGGVLGFYNSLDVIALPLIATQDANSFAIDPLFAVAGGTTATDYLPSPVTLNGISGTGITTDYTAANRSYNSMGAYDYAVNYNVHVIATTGTLTGNYNKMKDAFDAINSGIHTGAINIELNINTTETAAAVLNASGSGSASYSAINIYPVVTGLSIIGNLATPLIDLSGADNVTIDGRLNATGSTKDLVISNTNTSATASTIRFIGDASSNTVKYCTVSGSGTSVSLGTINFITGTTTGNDNNTITESTITSAGSNLPYNAIYSAGTSTAIDNSGMSITNNNIQDYFSASLASNGIYVASNSAAWTITGNKLFQSATRTTTVAATHRAINIITASGGGYTISNNIIGYSSAAGTGATTYTGSVANWFYGIQLTASASPVSSIQGNTVTAISLSTASNSTTLPGIFSGISILAGSVNIGTIAGNTIGATTGTGAITIATTLSAPYITAIHALSTGTVSIQNNNIGAISTGGATGMGYYLYPIYTSGAAGNFTISGNTIGSTTTAHSITVGTDAATTVACSFYGIYQMATGTISITGNTIQNCTVYGTVLNNFYGIYNLQGTVSITSNNVLNLTYQGTGGLNGIVNSSSSTPVNINSNTVNNLISTAGIGGITSQANATTTNIYGNSIYSFSSTGASDQVMGISYNAGSGINIYSNTIYDLSGSGTTSPSVNGIAVTGGATVHVYKNKIYNLYESGAISTTSPAVIGIWFNGGTPTYVYNNFISELKAPSANLADAIRGISITAVTGSTAYNVYNNTVYMNATSTGTNFGSSGIYHTAAFNSSTTAALDLRNNIIVNNSTANGTGLTVAYRRSVGTSLYLSNYATTSNYNNFYAGTPSASNLIYYDGTSSAQYLTSYRSGVFTAGTIAPRDANSVSELSPFVNVTTSPYDLHINTAVSTVCEGRGSVISTPAITTDYDNDPRYPNASYPVNASYPPAAPDLGADEFGGIPFGLTGTINVGSGQTYTSLTNINGLFDYINTYGLTGNLTALITSDLSSESGSILLNQWSGSNTLTISPTGGVARTVSGTYNGALITLNGADNAIFDGLNTGGNSLVITNASTGTLASTIKFINDATNNTITNCTIKGATTNTLAGVLFFSSGTTTGNTGNSVSNCNITKDAAGTPIYLLYSNGTATKENVASIANNNFYDFRDMAIWLAGGSKNWIINGNSIYQTTTSTSTTSMEVIRVQGDGYTIYGNYIGGSSANCGGTALTVNSAGAFSFYGIEVYGATNPATSIYNNTIQNINITTVNSGYAFSGIYAYNGDVNIGTSGANTIGSATGTGSIIVNSNFAGGSGISIGIFIPSSTTGTKNISNNIIGSINAGNTSILSGAGHKFYGILAYAGTITITNNTIGSTTTANSINATNSQSTGAVGDAQFIHGIDCQTTGAAVITGNTIANLNNSWLVSTASAYGVNYGIYVSSPSSANISNNTIYGISTAQPQYSTTASIYGIAYVGTTLSSTISSNTIYDLRNTSATQATKLVGINYSGTATANSNQVSKNLIHSLYTASNTSVQYGIYVSSGYASFRNNLIRLGIDKDGAAITSSAQINGIQNVSATTNLSSFQFNTVYIGGTGVVAGAVKTYAFYKSNSSYDTIRNNIFVNVRQNAVATRQHYAIYYPNPNIPYVSDYNLFYYSATDGQLDQVYSTMQTFRAYQIAAGKISEMHSAIGDPKLINPTGSTATLDMNVSIASGTTPVEGTGLALANITDDYAGQIRTGLTPTDMGAYAGDFNTETVSDDIFTPVISYTTFVAAAPTATITLSAFATVTDQISGVNTTSGTRPRIYYKLSTNANAFVGNTSANNGWKWVEASNSSSPFDFTIDHSLLFGGTPATGTINYFVVAQDLATTPNFMCWPLAGSVGTGVNSMTTAPTTPSSYIILQAPVATAADQKTVSGFRANWSASVGATGYYLDVATDIAFTSFVPGYNNLDVANVLNATLTGLTINTYYYYRIRAYNLTGTSVNSNIITANTVQAEPTLQATNISFTSDLCGGTVFNFTRGDGANCAVFVIAASTGSAVPLDGTTYVANSTYALGGSVAGWYCVYNGTGNVAFVSGLTLSTTYRVMVVEYNGTAGFENYLTSTATGNPANYIAVAGTSLTGTKYIQNSGGDYPTIGAAAKALNNCGVGTGGVTFVLGDATYPNESFPLTFNAITGASSGNLIKFQPAAGVGVTVSGSYNGNLILLNGTDYITFDGLNTGGSSLIIENSYVGTGASTINISNGATYNSIANCIIKGSTTSNTCAVVNFSTGINTNNTVSYCNIGPSGVNKPWALVYTNTATNTTNTIDHCNLFDYYNSGVNTNLMTAIYLGNGDGWTISNNSIYFSTSITASGATLDGISLVFSKGNTISGNYFGGSTSLCGGSAMTITGSLYEMRFIGTSSSSAVNTNVTSVVNNTISNINVTSNNATAPNAIWDSRFTPFFINGGYFSIRNNTVGSMVANDNIVVDFGSTASQNSYAICQISSGVSNNTGPRVSFNNNNIGGITSNTTSFYSSYFVKAELNSVGNVLIVDSVYNNTFGSTLSNSLKFTNDGAGTIWGVFFQTTSNVTPTIVSGNTIQNLTRAGTGLLCGIYSMALQTNTGNTIKNFSSASSSVTGINITNVNNITTNKNYISNLQSTSLTASIYGIYASNTGSNISNNIVRLGVSESVNNNKYGIYIVYGASAYFNSVYVGGTGTSGVNNSYAFYHLTTGYTNNIKNNIFTNARTNSGGTGSHYAIRLGSTVTAINYNDYFVSGSGGVLGYLVADKSTLALWKTATAQDANSLNLNAGFSNPSGTAATDFFISSTLNGVTGTGTTDDYTGSSRSVTTPRMGAWEMNSQLYTWTGTVSNSWNNGANWSTGTIPPSAANILISTGTPQLDIDYSAQLNLTINGTGTLTINPGKTLDIASGGVVDFGGKSVTLKSTSDGTASIGQILGTLSNATNITVERWIPLRSGGTGRAYRLLAPSVNTTGSIKTNWMEAQMNTVVGTNVNTIPNYGTHITGSGGNGNGFDVTQSNASSLYSTANAVSPTYTAITSTAGTLNALTGYFLFVRGDRSMDMTLAQASGMPTSSTTLRSTGTLIQGTQTSFTNALIGGAGALNLVSNPYASAIDWSLVQASSTGITNYYTFWDPNSGTRGAFVTVGTDGTPSSGSANKYIQSGQAFFVEASGASAPTISIQEVHKVTGNNNNGGVFGPTLPMESFKTELYFTEASSFRRIADGVLVKYNNSYSTAIDDYDASEINNWDENIAIAREGKHLAIESRPVITAIDTIPLFMNNMKQQAYEFEFTPSLFTNAALKAELVDNFTGTRSLISVTATTVVSFTVTADPASSASDRFMVVFGPTAPLAIDQITIQAKTKNTGIQVDWIAKTETDMDRYELERSADGLNFIKLNTTTAIGNSRTAVTYSWFDSSPQQGNNYYRVKAFDKAGMFKYSAIVKISPSKLAPGISIYPNPVEGNKFNISLNNMAKGTYQLSLINNLGQTVMSKQIVHEGGTVVKEIDWNYALGQGVYYLLLKGDNAMSISIKIIKN